MNIGGTGPSRPAIAAKPNGFDVVARWVETLHGHGEFRDALSAICDMLSGDVGNLIRVPRDGSASKSVAIVDKDAGKLFSNRRPKTFGDALIAEVGLPARDGSVWILSELLRDSHVELSRDLRDDIEEYGLRDLAIVPLQSERDSVDYLEIHFRSGFAEHNRVLFIAMAETLARAWSKRLPGTAERLIAQSRLRKATPDPAMADTAILDVTNPAELSRSEYRICALINEGLLVQEIASELNIRQSTMRSHLRSIYAKTGVSSHVELIHALSRGAGPMRAIA